MASRLRKLVSLRAANRCEYCRLHHDDLPGLPFHLEHVIPRKHVRSEELDNTAWSCLHCASRGAAPKDRLLIRSAE